MIRNGCPFLTLCFRVSTDTKTATTPSSNSVAAKTPDSSCVAAASPTKSAAKAVPVLPVRPESRCPNISQLRSNSLTASGNSSIGWPSGNSYVSPNPIVGSHTATPTSAASVSRSAAAPPARHRITTKAMSLDYNSHLSKAMSRDPFDTDWASIPSRTSEASGSSRSTNPFAQTSPSLIKTFEVQM